MKVHEPMLNLTVKRRAAGITQKELAKRLGIDKGTICAYENGRADPSLKMIKRLAKELHCEAKDII